MDKNVYLASKPRYEILDGLRGVAAMLVVFPLIVAMGAGSKVTDKRSIAVCKWLGLRSKLLRRNRNVVK